MRHSAQYSWAVECGHEIAYTAVSGLLAGRPLILISPLQVFVNRKELYHCPELDMIEPKWLRRRQNPDEWTDFVTAHGQHVIALNKVRNVAKNRLFSDRGYVACASLSRMGEATRRQ